MKLAQAAKALAKLIDDAIEARADCLRLEVMAQIRIAREYRAAQEKGEVEAHGGWRDTKVRAVDLDRGDEPKAFFNNEATWPASSAKETKPTITDLGLDKRRLSEWEKLADAGEDVVTQAITDALDAGREPTKADIARAVNENNGVNALRAFSGDNEYYTPARYIDAAREVMGSIDLDPATCEMAQQTVGAATYFTAEANGLDKEWRGRLLHTRAMPSPEQRSCRCRECPPAILKQVRSGIASQ